MSGDQKGMGEHGYSSRAAGLVVAVALACGALVAGRPPSVRAAARPQAEALPAPTPLALGERVTRDVTEAVDVACSIRLSAGDYVNVKIEHSEVCSPPRLLDPSGATVLTVWTIPTALNDETRIEHVAETSGVYEIVTRLAPAATNGRGTFALAAEQIRPATEVERARAAACRRMSDGVEALMRVPLSADARVHGLDLLAESRRMWHELGDTEQELYALAQFGVGCWAAGRMADTVGVLTEAVAIARARNDPDLLLPVLVNLASAYGAVGDGKAEDAALDEAFAIVDARDEDSYPVFLAYKIRLGRLRAKGDLRAARADVERAAEIGVRIGLGSHALDGEEATLAGDEGRLADALDGYRALVADAVVRGDLYTECASQMAIAQLYYALGEFQEAISTYERALALARTTPGEYGVSLMQTNLGGIYLEFGELDEAERFLAEGLRVARKNGFLPLIVSADLGVGRLHMTRGEPRAALAVYTEAVEALDRAGVTDLLASALTGVGEADAALGESAASEAAFERALDVADSRGAGDQEWTRLAYGTVLARRGAPEAAPVLERALEIGRSIRDRKAIATALYQLARVDRDGGRLAPAKARIREAIDAVESLRSGIKNPELRTSYFATVRSYYDLYADVLMREGGPASVAEAFAVAERGRGRVLLETLTERGVDLAGDVDAKLKSDEQEARRQLAGRLDYQVRLLSREHRAEDAEALAREISELERRASNAEGRLREASPAYASLTSPEPVTTGTLRRELLDSGTALVAYEVGEDAGYVWAVTAEGVTSARIPGRRRIEERVQSLRDAVAARACAPKNEAADEREARVKAADAAYAAEARALGDELLKPVAAALKGKRLAIVPDGALAIVPFGALVEPGTGRYVIEGHEVVTLPSVSSLAALRRQARERATPEGAVAVVADPVFDATDERVTTANRTDAARPNDIALAVRAAGGVERGACGERAGLERLRGSAREADAIAALAPDDKRLEATGFDANLDLATSGELGKYKVVHFATHGYVPAGAPELSGLVLSLVDKDGRERPGYLGMPQIYAMRLPVETVVLSACETGLGREVSGEGLVGLVRGFMYAGSSRVVSSLWKIDDEGTAGLMEAFYEGMLKRGRTPAAALREAQLKMIAEREPAYVWGAFQLAGEWR